MALRHYDTVARLYRFVAVAFPYLRTFRSWSTAPRPFQSNGPWRRPISFSRLSTSSVVGSPMKAKASW